MKRLLLALLSLILLFGSLAPVQAERFTFKKGATSQTVYIHVYDSSSTVGAGLTGLAFNTSNLVCYYTRVLGNATQITLATQTVTGAYSSGGFVEVSATNSPGDYRLDLPDAVLASGVDRAKIQCKGATNMVPAIVDVELVAYDPQDAAGLGLSRVDAAVTSRLAPTTAGRTLDVTANGEAGIDLDNAAGTLDAAEIGADAITAAKIAPDAIGASELAANAIGAAEVAAGALTPDVFSTAGTISVESGTTLSLSGGVAANDQFNSQARIVVYAAADSSIEASSCIVDTVNGSPDQVITAEDITSFIAVSDPFDIVPDASCATLRPTTPLRTLDVTATGEAGIDLNNTAGTLDAAEIGTDAITAAKIATDAIGASELAANAITGSEIADGAISDEVWGALRASYTTAGTFGQSSQVIRTGTAQAGASTTITLDASASATNDFYANARIDLIGGTGAGQTRLISSYVGSSKVATVNSAWATNPASDTVFVISGSGVNSAVTGLTAADVWTYATRSLTDKAGFSLTQTFPTNFSSLAITGGGAVTAGTVSDKTGYSLSQSFPTNFANLSIDANGRVDLSKWLGGTPNALASGRVPANAEVVGDKSGYSLTQNFPANFASLSIDSSGRVDISKVLGVSLGAQAGTNFNTFFQNGANVTTKVVDDVGGGGAGTTDWTTTERNQIRYRLGIDGATATPAATQNLGNLNINFAQTLPGSPTADTIGRALKYADTRLERPRPEGAVVAGAANCNGGTNSAVTFATNLSYTATNHFDRSELITFESGALAGQQAQITGYTWTGAVGCVTVSTTLGLTATPGVGDIFVIVNK